MSDEVQVATSALHTLVIAPDGRVLCQGRNQHAVCGVDQATAICRNALTGARHPQGTRGRGSRHLDQHGPRRGRQGLRVGPEQLRPLWRDGSRAGLRSGSAHGGGGARARHRDRGVRSRRCRAARRRHGVDVGGGSRGPARHRRAHEVVAVGEAAGHAATRAGPRGSHADRGRLEAHARTQVGRHGVGLGANKYAQLGLGDTDARAVPTRIPSLAAVTRIHAAPRCRRRGRPDGSWLVWGLAPSAQPPTDDGPPVRTPSPLPGLLRDASDMAGGAVAFCDGTVRTWGGNSFGSLGTGGSVDAVAPRGVLVRSLSGIVRVWSGGNRVLALKSDGTLYLWGPAGFADDRVFRVPTVMTTFALSAPRTP